MQFSLFDVVALTRNLSTEGLAAGTCGTVVEIHEKPALAYEVEFCDSMGRTIAQSALSPDVLTRADAA